MGLTIEYGQKFFHNDFNRSLKSIDNIESNQLSVDMISLNFMNYLYVGRRMKFISYSRFSFILPKQIEIDFVSQKLRGFNMTLPIYGHRLIDKKNFGLFISEGVQIGRLKLVDNEKRKMKNMTIAPYVGLVAKVNISKVCISFIAQYDYDISSKMWKKQWFHKGQDVHFDGLRQSGLTFSAGVGYAF